METSTPSGSPLRQRMIETMRMRKLMPKTRTAYIRAVRKFAKFLGRSADTATDEDLRRFQLHLIDQGTSLLSLNFRRPVQQAISTSVEHFFIFSFF
jgi:hypothetical protein